MLQEFPELFFVLMMLHNPKSLSPTFTGNNVFIKKLYHKIQFVKQLIIFSQLFTIVFEKVVLFFICLGVLSILQTRTSRRFLQSRLTPDMEQKLVFLTSNVRFGNHKRYQEWFQRQVSH